MGPNDRGQCLLCHRCRRGRGKSQSTDQSNRPDTLRGQQRPPMLDLTVLRLSVGATLGSPAPPAPAAPVYLQRVGGHDCSEHPARPDPTAVPWVAWVAGSLDLTRFWRVVRRGDPWVARSPCAYRTVHLPR